MAKQTVNGKEVEPKLRKCGKSLELTVSARNTQTVEVKLSDCTYLQNEDKKQALTRVISKFQTSSEVKAVVYGAFIKGEKDIPSGISADFRGPIEEILNLK